MFGRAFRRVQRRRAGSGSPPVSADRPDGIDEPTVRALFDSDHYAAQVGSAGPDGLDHYLRVGWRRGLDPHPLFATNYYLSHSPDVAFAGLCPLVHYARFGAVERRRPHPLFDPAHYVGHGGLDAAVDPLMHYLRHGGDDGRQPNAWFDGGYYRTHAAADVASTGLNPLVHYATVGWREGRRPHPDFDVEYYLQAWPELAATGAEPLAHFLQWGRRQGRAPSEAADQGFLAVRGAEITAPGRTEDDRRAEPPVGPLPPGSISIVVATTRPPATLGEVLAALEAQTAPRDRYEVVLVAGAGGDGLDGWADGVARRLVVLSGTGVAGGRNLGLFMARHPLVLFVADDEIADRDLVAEHVRAHTAHPGREVVIVGRTTWMRDASPFERWTELVDEVPLAYPGNARDERPDCVHARARNLSAWRSFLVRRGVFDPSFPRFHDVELAIRLRLAGLDLRSWPAARSRRLAAGDLVAEGEELRAQGPELARLAAADPSGAVGSLVALDEAAGRWARVARSFTVDVEQTRRLEADVAAGRGDGAQLGRRYRDVRWACRARGLSEASAPASARPPLPPTVGIAPPPARAGSRPRVLVVGVVLGDRPNTVAATAAELAASGHYTVEQRWVVVGTGGPDPEPPADLVVARPPALAPKFVLLGDVFAHASPAEFEYVLLVDDDVELPTGFLDAFLGVQRTLGMVLAQPARMAGSPADHPITLQQPGALARRTLFVEQGPVISVARSALGAIIPFDLRSPMGWGYEGLWSQRLDGMPIGIVDATPVAHRLRPVAGLYAKHVAAAQSDELLAAEAHRPLDECMRVLEAYPLAG